MERTLDTTNMEQAKFAGVEHEGDPGQWVCIGKAWNKAEGWMKSTKVLEVPGAGCFLQVTTKEKDAVAEAVCWAPGVKLSEDKEVLEADYGDVEDVEDGEASGMEEFCFAVMLVGDDITMRAFYCGMVVKEVSFKRSYLAKELRPFREVMDPFIEDVQEALDVSHGVVTSKEYLFRLLDDEVDRQRVAE